MDGLVWPRVNYCYEDLPTKKIKWLVLSEITNIVNTMEVLVLRKNGDTRFFATFRAY